MQRVRAQGVDAQSKLRLGAQGSEATGLVLGLPFLHDLLRGTWLTVLRLLIPRNRRCFPKPPIEVLLQLRKVLLRSSNQPTLPQSGLPLLLGREVIRERRGGLRANHRARLGRRRRRIELSRSGRFEFVRKFLKEARRLLLIRRGAAENKPSSSVTKAPLGQEPALVRTEVRRL